VGILPSLGAGATMAFSSTAAIQYRTPNATSLYEPLDDEQNSWFGNKNLLNYIYQNKTVRIQ